LLSATLFFTSCDDDSNDDDDGTTTPIDAVITPTAAFDDFNSSAVSVSFDGGEINIVSNGLPNHTSPYWPTTSDLFIDPIVADESAMSPGTIGERSYSLTVPAAPEIANNPSETGLGAIGIATTGAPIFNGQEGPNINLTEGIAVGFDYAGGHLGPTGYHYHTESADIPENTVLSADDAQLVGILSDGFLLYGRREAATNAFPTDLDSSGGHVGTTQHSGDEEFYHYHVVNELFTGNFILLFGADLQGTPNSIL